MQLTICMTMQDVLLVIPEHILVILAKLHTSINKHFWLMQTILMYYTFGWFFKTKIGVAKGTKFGVILK